MSDRPSLALLQLQAMNREKYRQLPTEEDRDGADMRRSVGCVRSCVLVVVFALVAVLPVATAVLLLRTSESACSGLLLASSPVMSSPITSDSSRSTVMVPAGFASASGDRPSVRIAFAANGDIFRQLWLSLGPHLFSNFSIVEWKPNLRDVWVVQTFFGGSGPVSIDRSLGQRRIFQSSEPNDCQHIRDFDAVIDTKLNPFTRPSSVPAVYQPGYDTASYKLSPAVFARMIKSVEALDSAAAQRLTQRKFAVYMQGHCVPHRDLFFDLLHAYRPVDAWGACKHNVHDSHDALEDKRWERVVDLYAEYKFVLCMENNIGVQGYVTEKLMTAMLAGSIPIYIGAPDIAQHFNDDSFVHVLSFSNLQHAMSAIVALDSNDTAYMHTLRQPWLHGNTFSHWWSRPRLNSTVSGGENDTYLLQQMRPLRDALMHPNYSFVRSTGHG